MKVIEFQRKMNLHIWQVCCVKVSALIGREGGPETWGEDIWEDALENLKFPDFSEPSEPAEAAASLCWKTSDSLSLKIM